MHRFLFSLVFLLSLCGPASASDATTAVPYTWHNVRIGGGGFVSGLVFQPKVDGLYYARTDVGGAYRWDAAKRRWVPLTDWIGNARNNWMGIESIAVDPEHPDRVYLAAGTYTVPSAGDGALLASEDRGRHFHATELPFPMGGNELGRGNGERLAVDPHDGNILFLGTPDAGLWRSNDRGRHWHKVALFPKVATSRAATAKNAWRRQPVGIVFVVFDPASGRDGKATPILYAGVSTRGTSLFRSDDGGRRWQAVPGQPTGLRPNHMVRSPTGVYYLSYGDEPGPDSMRDGAVWTFDPHTGKWTDITPIPRRGRPAGFGWGDVAVDPQHPEVLMASTFCHYTPHDELFRSVDGGRHWARVFPRSHFDHSSAVWTTHMYPHWISDIAIDPFDADHVLFVTGYGIWASRDMHRFDDGARVHWLFQDKGLEETVPLGLVSPPAGAHLLSAMGDLDGFRHDDLGVAPARFAAPPRYANSSSIAFAGAAPLTVVRAGIVRDGRHVVRAAYSLDGGRRWTAFAHEPDDGDGGGDIVVGAHGHRALWFPEHARTAHVTSDWGRHWTAVTGLPETATRLAADRVDARRFYALDPATATLYTSDDGGRHFRRADGAFARLARSVGGDAHVLAVPGHTAELYLGGRSGLIRGRVDGTEAVRLATVDAVDAMGLGKPAPGHAQPTLYLSGRVDGRAGLFRSLDGGVHWRRIDDAAHRYGRIREVTGDPRVFGRVYLGTGGRGIVYGDPAGTPP